MFMSDHFCGGCGERFETETARFCAKCGRPRVAMDSDERPSVVGEGPLPPFTPLEPVDLAVAAPITAEPIDELAAAEAVESPGEAALPQASHAAAYARSPAQAPSAASVPLPTELPAVVHEPERTSAFMPDPEPASVGEAPGYARAASRPPPSNPLAALNLPVIAGLPGELWAVVAAFAIPGAWVLIDALKALPDALNLINAAFFGWKFGTLISLLVVAYGLVGVGLLANALLVFRADRAARGLAYASAGTIALATFFTNGRTNSLWAALIGSIVAVVLLAGAPNCRAHLSRSEQIAGGAPASVRAGSFALWAYYPFALLGALIYVVYGLIEAKWFLAVTLFVAMTLVAYTRQAGILRGDRKARTELTTAGVAFVLLLLIFTKHSAQLIVSAGLVASSLALLWLQRDARVFFGDPPLAESKLATAAATQSASARGAAAEPSFAPASNETPPEP
jgi:hypothetical protein